MSSTIPGYDKVEPRVYYGERTVDRVYVNSRQGEFDYPQGDQNVYGHYQGLGGVRLGSGFRKLAFAFEDGGIRLLLANEMTDSTKVMWDRDIKSRVAKLAPFLKYDRDVYAVPSPEEGKLYLVVDGYTHTNHYPYAESCDDLNYVRNAVKVVLDCYNGTTTYYIFDEQDPLIKVWAKVFPTLFRPKSEMPVGVMEHVRYPEDMLSVQSRVYGTYHMTDPQTWINKEDLWDVAHEVFGSRGITPLSLDVQQQGDAELGPRVHASSQDFECPGAVEEGVGARPDRALRRAEQLLVHAPGIAGVEARHLWTRPHQIWPWRPGRDLLDGPDPGRGSRPGDPYPLEIEQSPNDLFDTRWISQHRPQRSGRIRSSEKP